MERRMMKIPKPASLPQKVLMMPIAAKKRVKNHPPKVQIRLVGIGSEVLLMTCFDLVRQI